MTRTANALSNRRAKSTKDLVKGKIDRSLLSSDADAYFTRQVLDDASASLKALGPPESLNQTSVELRGGMTYRHFLIQFKGKSLHLSTLTLPNGKLEQYLSSAGRGCFNSAGAWLRFTSAIAVLCSRARPVP